MSGWEGADWFAGAGLTPEAIPTWGWAPWFDRWREEHRVVREGVGLMDMSFMAKYLVEGASAGTVLDRLSAGAVDGEPDTITYTQWLDDDGRILADLTVTKLGAERFLVVASDTAAGAVLDQLRRGIGEAAVTVRDVTDELAQLNVQGPQSRSLLAGLTPTDLGTPAWPFRTARRIQLAGVEVLCARITYLGELGYELYVAAEDALGVYDAITGAGRDLDFAPVGLKSLASLRMEKGYRDFGHDIDNTDCPLEAGLGFAIAWDTDFRGREAVTARREANAARGGMSQRLVQLRLVDPEPLLYHAEVVYRSGEPVGYVRAASYGWTLGSSVALAMVSAGDGVVTADWLSAGEWTVDVAGVRHAAEVSLRPFYDPTSARVRA